MQELRLKDDVALNVLKNLMGRSTGYQKQALKQAIEYYDLVMTMAMEDDYEGEGNTSELPRNKD